MKRIIHFAIIILLPMLAACSTQNKSNEFYVSPQGSDNHPGTREQPFKTIQKAADIMQPGDICTVLEGVYREWIVPARGGNSESERITYRAAKGHKVVIKGSEVVTGWKKDDGDVWKVEIEDSFFRGHNPFKQKIEGEFIEYGHDYHMGDVYLNGQSFKEKLNSDSVFTSIHSFFADSFDGNTILYANFGEVNPNDALVEVNVRECVFFPKIKGLKYITVEGFTMQHAAANWAYFRAYQQALIGTYYGYGWIIQNNTITDARCVGIVCGNDPSHQNEGFDISVTGHHIIRNNIIRRCGEAGIHGFKGWAASVIENNLIEDINTKDEFGGWETGGIKVHDAVDITIRNNIFRRIYASKKRGEFAAIWVDWGGQGVRVSGNIVYDCTSWGLYLQNNHGPILVDNNILLEPFVQASDNCVLVHNLFADCQMRYDVTNSQFEVVYYEPHTATPVSIDPKNYVNDVYYNNIFTKQGSLQIPEHTKYRCDYNVLYQGAAKSSWGDINSLVDEQFDAKVEIETLPSGVKLTWLTTDKLYDVSCPLISYDLIGKMGLPNQGIENYDGSPVTIDVDITGAKRDTDHPTAGPVENSKTLNTLIRKVKGASQ